MNEEDIRKLDKPAVYKTRKTVTDEYINMIYKMILDNIRPENIFSYVLKKGYKGSWKALDNRICRLLKNNFGKTLNQGWYLDYRYPIEITVIKRNDILGYITTKNEKAKKNKAVEENIEKIKGKYPIISEFGGSGIEKDIAPVKNAISYPNSSGFVEGNNNKFKLIKRILYGRSNLVNLFKKCYLPFLMNNVDFKLQDVIQYKNSTISHTT